MTTATNSFEGGADGQLITVANSGGASGTAFSADSGYTYSTAQAAHGTRSALAVGSGLYPLSHALTGTGTRWVRAYLRSAVAWGDSVVLMLGGAFGMAYQMNLTDADVQVKHYNGIDSVTLATISAAPAVGQWIRVEMQAVSGPAGATEARLYNTGDSVTPTGTATGSRSQADTAWAEAAYGESYPPGNQWLDSVGWSDEGWLGPVVPPAAPRRVHAGNFPAVVRGATW